MTPSPIEHLSDDDLETIGAELDAIRDQVMADVGEHDADYIRNVIRLSASSNWEVAPCCWCPCSRPAWLVGTAALSVAKIVENMEIGHNVMHGQWDWMRDPKIHSSTWEWDNVSPADRWKHSHNVQHHIFTNVVGKDDDLGYGIMRVDEDQPWHPVYLAQPVYNLVLAAFFEWGVALHDLELDEARRGRKTWSAVKDDVKHLARKAGKQLVKDYVVVAGAFRPLGGAGAVRLAGREPRAQRLVARGHLLRSLPRRSRDLRLHGGAARRGDPRRLVRASAARLGEPRRCPAVPHHGREPVLPDRASPLPDVPSNRYQEIAPRVREVCEHYGLPYTSGPLYRQYAQVLIKIARYALPGGGPSEASDPRDVEASPPAPGRTDVEGRRGMKRERHLESRDGVIQRPVTEYPA